MSIDHTIRIKRKRGRRRKKKAFRERKRGKKKEERERERESSCLLASSSSCSYCSCSSFSLSIITSKIQISLSFPSSFLCNFITHLLLTIDFHPFFTSLLTELWIPNSSNQPWCRPTKRWLCTVSIPFSLTTTARKLLHLLSTVVNSNFSLFFYCDQWFCPWELFACYRVCGFTDFEVCEWVLNFDCCVWMIMMIVFGLVCDFRGFV